MERRLVSLAVVIRGNAYYSIGRRRGPSINIYRREPQILPLRPAISLATTSHRYHTRLHSQQDADYALSDLKTTFADPQLLLSPVVAKMQLSHIAWQPRQAWPF